MWRTEFMLARLGNVFYWMGCGLAVLAWVIAILMIYGDYAHLGPPRSDFYFVLGLAAVTSIVIWLLGRAARYVLAGT
jgi:hypothetical protein